MLPCAYLVISGPISSSQAPTLSISTICCQMRQARGSAPAPTMRLSGVNLSVTLQFASPLTVAFACSVRPTAANRLALRREKSLSEMTTVAQVCSVCHVRHVLE